jgi:hypothetical protein
VRIAKPKPIASAGAVIAINANDTYSFVVIAFMRFFFVASYRLPFRDASLASRMNISLTRDVPSSLGATKTNLIALSDHFDVSVVAGS